MTSKAKSNKTCIFFRKASCSKGEYCEFSHALSDNICKNFIQGFCKYGNSCNFQHSKCKNILKTDMCPSSSISKTEIQDIKCDKESSRSSSVQNIESELDRLWGLETENTSNIYFYGAAGKYDSKSDQKPSISYANVVGKNEIETEYINNSIIRDTSVKASNTICSFFASGNCRFGETCKNLHEKLYSSSTESANDILYHKQDFSECGICMSVPKDGTYGILNNCNCTFCLTCVREWRREGNLVTKSLEQVRLCPLCRRQSYFVVPCTTPITDSEQKSKVIQVYKDLMASKPCKYVVDGECPFGSSCFYSHGDVSDKNILNRTVLNTNGESELLSRRQLLLSDIIYKTS